MHIKTTLTFAFNLFVLFLFAQSNLQQATSINGDGALAAPSAMLDVSATDKGMLVPRLTTAQRTAIASPATGLLVFDTETGSFWFFDGTDWADLSALPDKIQDADDDTKIQVEESPDEDAIRFDLAGTEHLVLKKNAGGKAQLALPNNGNNILIGENAGNGNTTGFSNVAIGKDALFTNTDRSNLVAVGDSALYHNGMGVNHPDNARFNTAIGSKALYSNTTGSSNTANGCEALFSNTEGSNNTANGYQALYSNKTIGFFTGSSNTANGYQALYSNTLGSFNTAIGGYGLSSNTMGVGNTASGGNALSANVTGNYNTANGYQALLNNISGSDNTANGYLALYSNTAGTDNTANGQGALEQNFTGNNNTAVGSSALSSNLFGSLNTALGYNADVSSSSLYNATAIGAQAEVATSNSLVLGSINGVNGASASVNVGIGTTAPELRLHIEGGTDAATSGGGFLQIGESSAVHLAFDNNEIMARNNGAVTTLNLNTDGGNVRLGTSSSRIGIGRSATTNTLEVEGAASKTSAGSWLANSDARLKKNILPLNCHETLQKLLALQGITYEWDDDKTGYQRPKGIQFGFTAQNVLEVFPTLVSEDNIGYLQTAYGTYDAMLVEALRSLYLDMKDGKKRIEKLEGENKELRSKNAAIKAQLSELAAQLHKISAALQGAGITEGE